MYYFKLQGVGRILDTLLFPLPPPQKSRTSGSKILASPSSDNVDFLHNRSFQM